VPEAPDGAGEPIPQHADRTDSGGGSGNRARDHLANERTYLSWLRTALGMLALAAAVARFGPQLPTTRDHVAVAVIAALGLGLLTVGTVRYYEVSRDLEAGLFRQSRRAPLVVAILVALTAVVVLPLLL
jgi:putative membrane protein